MTRRLRLLFPTFLLAFSLFAQTETDLPRYLTTGEMQLLQSAKYVPGFPEGTSAPPPVPVRAMGEWEELQALLVTWQAGSNSIRDILTEIVRAARLECRVIVCCNNQTILTNARNYLIGKSVDVNSNVEFLVVPNNSIWIRDYGPNCVYANGVDSLYFIDWRYNRPRPQDDTLASRVSQYLGVPLYSTFEAPADMVNTGGNFMADGLGTAFASRLILDENKVGNTYGVSAKTETQIDGIMSDYMGIQRYIKMDVLPYDAIHHIDMHMKLLDEETLLVGQYPMGIADGPQIEANIQYVLSGFQSAFGTPYQVVRVPMPPHNGKYPDTGGNYRTYANAIFVNKTVLVPFYEEQFDTTAQRIWENALPGYNIVGIDCNAIIPSLGALHCITKEVGVADPLPIVHQPLPCMENATHSQYPVWANLNHRSGIASARIHYTTDLAGPWESVELPVYSPNDTTWSHRGFIPGQPGGSTVYYYIEGTSASGKTVVRPLTAPQGYWSFCVTETVSTAAVEPVEPVELAAIYPNPASAITVVPVYAPTTTRGSLRLYNTLGQLAQTIFEGDLPAGQSQYFFDAARFPAGTYWVELRAGEQVAVQKLLIR
ncbi:MAG: agmatine deiminase family protein [Lewinellaceae bacterium]|nr:agmatine deiminase family protein [Lewinellaceae bacterium]